MIRGNKVVLRDIRDGDIEVMTAWRNDPQVNKYFFEYEPVSYEKEKLWVEALRERKDEKLFIIAPLENPDRAIGTVGLVRIDHRNKKAEWGRFQLGDSSSRGQGLAAEAIYLSLQYAFDHLNLRRIYLEVFAWNDRARSLYESFGFKIEGTYRAHIYREGTYHDVAIYGLLEHEFRKNEQKIRERLRSIEVEYDKP